MKKIFLSLCVMFALFGFASTASAGFLTGYVVGSMMSGDSSSSSSQAASASAGEALYVMPRVAERVKDPLQMRTKVSITQRCVPSGTLSENFTASVENSGNYEVLQVLRVGTHASNECFVYWFTYIEKSQVTPIEQLPQPKPTK